MVALIVLVPATLRAGSAPDGAGPNRAALIARLDAYVASGMGAAGDPGAALVVVDGGRVVHCRGFGSDAHGQPVTCSTRFAVASLTKGFTALAVLAAAERGRLRLDAPVTTYLPWFRPADDPPIRVNDLLLMRSGLRTADGKAWLASRDDDGGAIERRVRALDRVRLFAAPGSAPFAYSNANYAVLGAVLQAVDGKPFEAVARERVLAPLGITGAEFSRDARAGGAEVRGFSRIFGVPVRALPAPRDRGDDPAAGMVIDALEFGRYLGAQLDAGASWSGRVLSREGWQRLHASPPDSPYAMGWYDNLVDGGKHHLYWHDGLAPDFHAYAAFVPHRDIGAALLVNASEEPDGGRREHFDRGIVRILLGQPSDAAPPAFPADLPLRLAVLAGLVAAAFGGLHVVPSRAAERAVVRRRFRQRMILRAGISVAFAVAMWWLVTPAMGGSLEVGLVYSPDLGAMLIALFGVLAASAVVSVARAVNPGAVRVSPGSTETNPRPR